MRKHWLLGVGLGSALAAAVPGASAADGPGSAAFQFLNLGAGARIEALGEAGTAVADGVDALTWNPARLALSPGGELAASYFNWLDDVQVGSAGITWPAGPVMLGLGVRSLSVSDFGNVAGEAEVGQSDLAVSVGGAYPLAESLHAGLGVKLVRSSLAGRDAAGLAADLGMNYRWVEGWDVAAAVRNFGRALSYVDGVDENLPTQAAFGIGSTFGELRVDSEVVWEKGPGWVGVLGAEFRPWSRLALRLGGRLGEDAGGAREPWAAGLGITARPGLDLEYAFRDGAFDASHRLGVRWTPGRSLGAAGETVARSPREFYVDVLKQALERSLVNFPAEMGGTVVVRSSAQHVAKDVISETLAGILRERGLSVEVNEPFEPIPDDLSEEMREQALAKGMGVPPIHPVVEYEVVTSDYEILRSHRERWVGPKSTDRRVAVDLAVTLTAPDALEPGWSSTAYADETETVATAAVPSSAGYPQARSAAAKERKRHPLVEPAIVGGLVTGLAVIFFSNRDVGN